MTEFTEFHKNKNKDYILPRHKMYNYIATLIKIIKLIRLETKELKKKK